MFALNESHHFTYSPEIHVHIGTSDTVFVQESREEVGNFLRHVNFLDDYMSLFNRFLHLVVRNVDLLNL